MSQRIGKLCRIKEKAMSQQTTAHPDAALYFAPQCQRSCRIARIELTV